MKRREMLSLGLAGLGTIIASNVVAAESCTPNSQQPEGPFYPVKNVKDKDNNLIRLGKSNTIAKGEKILFWGQVTDQNCQPVVNTLVEIWQACHSGRYNHPGDPDNGRELDAAFQYWGICPTDKNGIYKFLTIIPGDYPADTDWIRPAHIHMHIQRLGYGELITQAYFAGNPYNAKDKILTSLPPAEQERCTMPRKQLKDLETREREELINEFSVPASQQNTLAVYRYDVTIKKLI